MRFLVLLALLSAVAGCRNAPQPNPEPGQGRLTPLKEEVDQVEPVREKLEDD